MFPIYLNATFTSVNSDSYQAVSAARYILKNYFMLLVILIISSVVQQVKLERSHALEIKVKT